MMDKRRDKSLDIAKGIAILLVVWGHAGNDIIQNAVAMIHLPVFFFISGLLFCSNLKKPLKVVVKKIIKSIYVPYLIAELVAILFHNSLFKIGWYNEGILYGGRMIEPYVSIFEVIKEVAKVILLSGREPIIGSIWFLVTLLLLEGGYYTYNQILFCKWLRENKSYEIVIDIIISIVGLLSNHYFYVGRITPVAQYWIYFSIGSLYGKDIKKYISANKKWVLVVPVFILSIIAKFFMPSNLWILENVIQIAGSFSVIIIILAISNYLKEKTYASEILQYFGKRTLDIMILHFVGFKILSSILHKMEIVNVNHIYMEAAGKNSVLISVVYLFFGVTITCMIEWLANKIKEREWWF